MIQVKDHGEQYEPAVKAAVKAHRQLKRGCGKEWNAKIEPWLQLLRREMKRNGLTSTQAMDKATKEIMNNPRRNKQMVLWVTAAWVEMDLRRED